LRYTLPPREQGLPWGAKNNGGEERLADSKSVKRVTVRNLLIRAELATITRPQNNIKYPKKPTGIRFASMPPNPFTAV
jgi:hypothetical protein